MVLSLRIILTINFYNSEFSEIYKVIIVYLHIFVGLKLRYEVNHNQPLPGTKMRSNFKLQIGSRS